MGQWSLLFYQGNKGSFHHGKYSQTQLRGVPYKFLTASKRPILLNYSILRNPPRIDAASSMNSDRPDAFELLQRFDPIPQAVRIDSEFVSNPASTLTISPRPEAYLDVDIAQLFGLFQNVRDLLDMTQNAIGYFLFVETGCTYAKNM
jgi:hypothetical protein